MMKHFDVLIAAAAVFALSVPTVSGGVDSIVAEMSSAAAAAVGDGNGDDVLDVPDVDESAEGLLSDVPLVLNPVEVIRNTVRFSPQIRRAYERKLAEESRYDFFIVSREALSYGTELEFDYSRPHDDNSRSLEKTLSPQVFLRKEFYNTASTSLKVGYGINDYQNGHDGSAFVRAGLEIPLFASREALQRSNDKIYQQNKVNDARLNYFRQIRMQILFALNNFTRVQQNQEMLRYQDEYAADLEEMLEIASKVEGRDTAFDKGKIEATLASLQAEREGDRENQLANLERLKMVIGIPFETPVLIEEERFNPFEDETRDQLENIALETDEEIKTLINSIKASQAELQLARKGKWDTSLYIDGDRAFDGSGDSPSDQGYSLSTGVTVTRIDSRISRSLEKIALANVREYRNAILARRREIHADTVQALTHLSSQTAEAKAREKNLASYRADFEKGVEQYKSGLISIDELIQKREQIFWEQGDIARCREHAREGVANLLASTGRYEEFLDEPLDGDALLSAEQDSGE